jgi:alpha-L-fucosidase
MGTALSRRVTAHASLRALVIREEGKVSEQPHDLPDDSHDSKPVYSQADLQELISQSLAASRAEMAKMLADANQATEERHQAELTALQQQIAGLQASMVGTVPSAIREHGGGVGLNIHPTWSQWEQEELQRKSEAALAAARG